MEYFKAGSIKIPRKQKDSFFKRRNHLLPGYFYGDISIVRQIFYTVLFRNNFLRSR